MRMVGLVGILQRASERRLKAGGAVSVELINSLRSYRKRQFLIFAIIEGLLVCGVAYCAYYLMQNPTHVGQIKMVASLIGIGAGGGIEVMRRIWKEWSQTDLLLVLVEEASESQVTTIIDKLIKKL